MTISDQVPDLRARKQAANAHPEGITTSGNGSTRPALRLISPPTQVTEPAPKVRRKHDGPTAHAAGLDGSLASHTVTATHPPTLVDAAMNLWPSRAEVRRGFAGQLAAAAGGLVQLAGLAVCWTVAHAFFSTKTRAAIFALAIACGFAIYAAATHA